MRPVFRTSSQISYKSRSKVACSIRQCKPNNHNSYCNNYVAYSSLILKYRILSTNSRLNLIYKLNTCLHTSKTFLPQLSALLSYTLPRF